MAVDDQRGVGENPDENMCGCRDCNCGGLIARGTHLVAVAGAAAAQAQGRKLQQRLNDPLLLAFAALPAPKVWSQALLNPNMLVTGVPTGWSLS